MKKLFVILIAVFLLSLVMANTAFPSGPPENYSFYCERLKEDFPVWFDENWDSHGDCISFQYFQHITWCEDIMSNPAYGFENLGECLKNARPPWNSGPPENYSFYCKQLKEDFPAWFDENWDSHGDCISFQYFQHITWCEDILSNPAYGFENLGECLKNARPPWNWHWN
jgi:hypothetical protein